MRFAIDTHVLAYAEGLGDERRCGITLKLIQKLSSDAGVLPAQVLGELSRA